MTSIKGFPNSVNRQLGFLYLYGKYDDSPIRHHVQEQRHRLVFVWRVRVKRALRHDTPTGLVQHQNVDAPSLVLLIVFQDLASYIYIKFLSLQFISFVGRNITGNSFHLTPSEDLVVGVAMQTSTLTTDKIQCRCFQCLRKIHTQATPTVCPLQLIK